MSDRVCVTGREVRDFIDNYKFTRRNLKKNSDLFNAMKQDIQKQIKLYGTAENEFYRRFNLSGGLPEFQKRFDEILSGNLHQFSSVYLQESNLFTQTFKPITNEQIGEWVKDWVEKLGYKAFDRKKGPTDKVVDVIADIISKEINKSRKENAKEYSSDRGEVKPYYLKGRIKDLLKGKGIKLGEYKKDFKILMQHKDEKYSNSTYEMEFDATFSIEDDSDIEEAIMPLDEFSYYPYFGLNKTQEKEAKSLTTEQSKRVWRNFKNHVKSFVVGDISGSTVETIMDQLGPSAFIKSDLNGVKGILGELQMLLVVAKLMGETNINKHLLATGPLRNKLNGSAELGADVLIDGTIGLQVKNYKGNWFEDKPVNYWLSNELSFSTFQDRVKENGDFVDFDKYVAILNYNKPNWAGKGRGARGMGFNKDSYEKYENYYNNKIAKKSGIINSATKLLVAENMDKFLSLEESYELLSGDMKDLYTKGDYTNAFYIFGGRDIIPIRVIFELLLKRIDELEKAIAWKQSGKTDNFFVKYNYNGTVWPVDVTKDQDANYSTDKTIQSVLDDLKIELKLNIWLSDLNIAAHTTSFR